MVTDAKYWFVGSRNRFIIHVSQNLNFNPEKSEPCQVSEMEIVNSLQYFPKKALPEMFEKLLNTPKGLMALSFKTFEVLPQYFKGSLTHHVFRWAFLLYMSLFPFICPFVMHHVKSQEPCISNHNFWYTVVKQWCLMMFVFIFLKF